MQGSARSGAERRALASAARLYLCLPAAPAGDRGLLDEVLREGVDIVQLRDPGASDDELVAAGEALRRAAAEHEALFIVNDRPDIALAAGADGVHVGQEDGNPASVRRAVGEDLLIGVSTHAPHELGAAAASEADLISVGPVWQTPTKPGRPATGLEYVTHAASAPPPQPWFAIGGIDTSNVGQVLAAGATRIVVVRAIIEADDPGAAARDLRSALEAPPVAGAAR